MTLSIIVPVSKHDNEWVKLNKELSSLDIPYECLFVSIVKNDFDIDSSRWLVSDIEQRAYQMNLGAKDAQYDVVWFLHADSIVSNVIAHMKLFLENIDKRTIYYFDLRFSDSKSILTKLNEQGAFLRSRVFDLPFGDQGLLMSKSIFFELGGFDESKPFAEDFYFIKLAKKNKFKIHSLKKIIYTSARKYNNKGWLKTTWSHVKFTISEMIK